MLLKTDGVGIPKNNNCAVCGKKETTNMPIIEHQKDLLTEIIG